MRRRWIWLVFTVALAAACLLPATLVLAAKPELYVTTTLNNASVYSNVLTLPVGVTTGIVDVYTEPTYDKVYLQYQSGGTWYSSTAVWTGTVSGTQTLPSACYGNPIRLWLTTDGSTVYSGTHGRLTIGGVNQVSGGHETWNTSAYFTAATGKRIASVYTEYETGGDGEANVVGSGYSINVTPGYIYPGLYGADVTIPVGPPMTQVAASSFGYAGASPWPYARVYYPIDQVSIAVPAAPNPSLVWDEAGQHVDFTWPLVQDATSYEIWRDGSLKVSLTGFVITWTDATAPRGTTVTYVMKAINSLGSGQATRTFAVPPATPPTAPTLTWSTSPVGVGTSWTAVSGATTYRIWRSGSQVGTSATTSFVDTGAGRNVSYTYTIQAGNAVGFSLQGPGATILTPPAPPVLTYAHWSNSTYKVELTWNAVSGAAKYGVYRNDVKIGEATATSYSDSTAPRGTTVQYKMTSFSSTGYESERSGAYSVSTAPSCPTVTSLQSGPLSWSKDPNNPGRGFIALSWTPTSGATGYEVAVHNGYKYEVVQSGAGTTWDSRTAKIYPAEAALNMYLDDDWEAQDILYDCRFSGTDLRDTPKRMYQKTPGETYDADNSYRIVVRAFNALQGTLYSEYTPVQSPTLDNRTDLQVPTVSDVTINGGQLITSVPQIIVSPTANDPLVANWTASTADDASGVSQICFSDDGSAWSAYEAFSGTLAKAWTLPSDTAGLKTVYVKVKDLAGNETAATQKINFFLVDAAPPKVKLEVLGAPVVYTGTVTLKLDVSDDTTPLDKVQVRYSNDNATWTSWASFTPTKTWTLTAGDGDKAVYVQAKDLANNYGSAVAACALKTSGTAVQQSAAVFDALTGVSGTYKNGADLAQVRYTRNPEVHFKISAAGRIQYSFDNMTWYSDTTGLLDQTVTLTDWDGYKTLYVRTQSGSTYVQRYVLDTTPPKMEAWWLGGATVAPGGAATVVIDAHDNISAPDQLQVSLDGGATWLAYSASKGVTLSGSGYKVLVVQVRDQAGNISQKVLEILVS